MASADLDPTDFRILSELTRDGRLSFASLGAMVGLSPHGAADRVRRLTRQGVITRFTAVLDLGRAGRALEAFIDVRMHPSAEPEKLEDLIQSLPTVREYAFVTGRFDYEVRVACSDPEGLDQTVRSLRKSGLIAATETRIVMRTWRNSEIPAQHDSAGRDSHAPPTASPPANDALRSSPPTS